MSEPTIEPCDTPGSGTKTSPITGLDGAIVVGGGSTLHTARKIGVKIEVLCKCASAQPRVGRPPVRFFNGLKPNCPGGGRSRKP